MKILHLLDSLNRGGTETLILDVCRNANNHGFDLTFVATGGGDLEAEFQEAAPRLVRLERRLPVDPRIIWQLRRVIQAYGIEIVHAHQAVEGLHAFFAALGTKAKVVLSFHGFVSNAKNRRALKFLIPRVARNVFVSESLRRWYAAEVDLKVLQNYAILHNGVDAKRLKPTGKNLRSELKLPPDALLLGMIGNFYVAPRKNQITLVRALPIVFEKFQNAYCIFVGSIEDGAETKFAECVKFAKANGILERTKFLGVRADVPDILNALDVFVLSTFHEGLPIAVLEAMLTGAPCVLSDIAPNLEVSENGKYAEIFETGNAEELAEKLLSLLSDAVRRQAFAADAKSFADANYSIEAHLKSLKAIYEDIV